MVYKPKLPQVVLNNLRDAFVNSDYHICRVAFLMFLVLNKHWHKTLRLLLLLLLPLVVSVLAYTSSCFLRGTLDNIFAYHTCHLDHHHISNMLGL